MLGNSVWTKLVSARKVSGPMCEEASPNSRASVSLSRSFLGGVERIHLERENKEYGKEIVCGQIALQLPRRRIE